MSQRYKLYVSRIQLLYCKYTHCLCLKQKFLCITYTESVLSKFGATGCAPAGAFFPAKIHVLYFINIESVFLCLKYIKHVLSKLGVSKCAPAGAFFPAKIHLLYFICRQPPFLCLRYIQAQLLGSKVAFRVHETLVWHTPPDPPEVT